MAAAVLDEKAVIPPYPFPDAAALSTFCQIRLLIPAAELDFAFRICPFAALEAMDVLREVGARDGNCVRSNRRTFHNKTNR